MNKIKAALMGMLGLMAVAIAPVHAAVPTEATTAVTELASDAGTFVASFWPVVIAVIGTAVMLKLFRSFTSKST